MAIPRLDEDLNIIANMPGYYPGADAGLSPEAFKAEFDRGSLAIQRWINETLAPSIDDVLSSGGVYSVNGITPDEDGRVDVASYDIKHGTSTVGGELEDLGTKVNEAKTEAKAEANQYTDDKFFHTRATIPASAWGEVLDGWWAISGQTLLSVPGILESDTVFIDLAPEWQHSDARADIRDAFGLIDSFFPKDGGFDVYAIEKPEVDIPIVITAIRG